MPGCTSALWAQQVWPPILVYLKLANLKRVIKLSFLARLVRLDLWLGKWPRLRDARYLAQLAGPRNARI